MIKLLLALLLAFAPQQSGGRPHPLNPYCDLDPEAFGTPALICPATTSYVDQQCLEAAEDAYYEAIAEHIAEACAAWQASMNAYLAILKNLGALLTDCLASNTPPNECHETYINAVLITTEGFLSAAEAIADDFANDVANARVQFQFDAAKCCIIEV